jgi:hypothetical protein
MTLFFSSARHSNSARNKPTHPPPAMTMGRRSSDDAIVNYIFSNKVLSCELGVVRGLGLFYMRRGKCLGVVNVDR